MGTRRAGRCIMKGCVTLLAFASLWWGTAATSIAEDVTILGEEELFRLAMGERDHGNPYTSIELFHSMHDELAPLNHVIADYGFWGLRLPPRGYHWVRVDGDAVLAAVATGIVLDTVFHVFN